MSLQELPPRTDKETAQLRQDRIQSLVDYFLAQLRYEEVRKISAEDSAKMMGEDLDEILRRFKFWTGLAHPGMIKDKLQSSRLGGVLLSGDTPPERIIDSGPFRLDLSTGEIHTPYLSEGEMTAVRIRPKLQELTLTFFQNPNQVLTYDDLIERHFQPDVQNSTVVTSMFTLRKSVGDPSNKRNFKHFRTVTGYGFRYVP